MGERGKEEESECAGEGGSVGEREWAGGRQTGEREGRGNELMCESIIIEIIWNNTIIL